MTAKGFQDLVCWQLSEELRRRIFQVTARGAVLQDRRFREDIRAAARSSPANISEGFGRRNDPQFCQFLQYALASFNETQQHLGEGLQASYWDPATHDDLCNLAKRAAVATKRLLEYLRRCIEEKKRPNSRNRPRK
jgi:four helix bundle protein